MYALVSGQAGLAVCVQGQSVSVIRVDEPDEDTGYSIASIDHFFTSASDVIKLSEPSYDEIRRSLQLRWSLDRALRLFLISIDGEESAADVSEALDCLETLLSPHVEEYLFRLLCVAPLSSQSNVARTSRLVKAESKASNLLAKIIAAQPEIKRICDAWGNIPDELFSAIVDRTEFFNTLANEGVLANLVNVGISPKANSAIVEAFRVLAPYKNSRFVLESWRKALDPNSSSSVGVSTLQVIDDEDEPKYETDRPRSKTVSFHSTPSRGVYENVMDQQEIIEGLLAKGDEQTARRYAKELVEAQVGRGDKEYATKTLCRLAQEAKGRQFRSLALEWLELAVSIRPKDGWAHAQAADAFLYYGRLDDARREFEIAGDLGEKYVALTGRARILRAQGKYEEALKEIRQAKKEFADHEQISIAWLHEAEILREMWRPEEALVVYQEATKQFATEPNIFCGLAAVLVELGRPADAIKIYEDCIEKLGPNIVAISGRAQALIRMGRFDDSIAEYEKAIADFPTESVPRCGLAEALKAAGRREDALEAYDSARKDFRFTAIPFSGYAEVLKDSGEYDRALTEYDQALGRFPLDSHLLNGRASLLKLMGRFEDSLAAYDYAISKCPFDLLSTNGHALLLKELGRLDEAIAAYDRITSLHPDFPSARYGKASVFVIQKKYGEALKLLPASAPQTVDDWVAYHIRGMILLRTGRTDEAIEIFQRGVHSAVPFKRRAFENALALAMLKRGEYTQAIADAKATELKTERTSEGKAGRLLVLHALAGLKRRSDALDIYSQLSAEPSPAYIVAVRDEIAARFGLQPKPPQHDQQWLFDQECEAVLKAAA